MKNIATENPKEHWGFLYVENKTVLDMGCSFYEANFNPGMLSSAEWFVENKAAKVIGFDGDPGEVKKYNIVYKNNPKYNVFELYLNNETQIRDLLKMNPTPQVIKCDIEGAEINFINITKEEMENVEEIAFEYHDISTREMCETKLKEWGFDFIEQYSLLDRSPEHQGVYHGHKTQYQKPPIIVETPIQVIKKPKVPKILYIGPGEPILKSIQQGSFEDSSLDVKYLETDDNINEILTSFKPDSILTIGKSDREFSNLYFQPYNIRKRWFVGPELNTQSGQSAYYCAMNQILKRDNSKLISYFTPTYNTGVRLYETYQSLVVQTYIDWEWIIVDDSNDGGKTLSIAENIASIDPRVTVHSFKEKSKGIIGESKYRAATLCNGYLLVELDHDDLLTPNCTLDLYNASQTYLDAGFFYTDCVELNQYWQSLRYDDGFALGYGKYRQEQYNQHILDVCEAPNINPKTIRHIVGIPNHVRAWRRDTYFAIGGHNRDLAIADDYELFIRTFLHTKICKIPKLGYLQFMYSNGNEQNSHDVSRADIQRRVRTIADFYNEAIYNRFKELGVSDWVYESGIYDIQTIPNRYNDEENYVNYIN